MRLVGLTGGMGSGKTTVAEMFKDLGVAVYNSDIEAKRLMNENPEVRNKIKTLFGEKAYQNNKLNRKLLAEKAFNDKKLLIALNQVVHPAVREDLKAWVGKQQGEYVIQEAAILFENGGYKDFDKMILVTAPKKVRIARIKQRDGLTENAILERMQHQWSAKRKKELAQYVINNKTLADTRKQVRMIHEHLLQKNQ